MNWEKHILFGLIVSLIFIIILFALIRFDWKLILLSIPVAIFYSVLPDIDHSNSKITWFMIGISIIFIGLGILAWKFEFLAKFIPVTFLLIGFIILVVTFISAFMIKHHGFYHTVYMVFITPLLLIIILGFNFRYYILLVVAMIAYWTHLVCDGIPFGEK